MTVKKADSAFELSDFFLFQNRKSWFVEYFDREIIGFATQLVVP